MANIPQRKANDPEKGTKEAVISFRCDPEFKMQVDLARVRKRLTMQEAGNAAFGKYFGIAIPKKPAATAAQSPDSSLSV